MPESASECTLSASIDDEPEMMKAMNLMMAIPTFAPSAARIALLPPEVLTGEASFFRFVVVVNPRMDE
ncbi:hypothetical protein GCM10011399_01060 [Subtercola lobariae]|uniref:Uncharacterized protein n=1 Tax=Subtercola lobariae TaxID=1588641 RepID=A0A917B027_9MICO|nr:hypothetical protein GCM10011399_01060 [Subtercola lobariae]